MPIPVKTPIAAIVRERDGGLCQTAGMAVDPRGAELKRFLAEAPGGPVVMLNLLRFADGGQELYDRYAAALYERFLPRYGGEVLYAGDGSTALVAESGQQWDAVLLVRYPSPQRVFTDGRRPRLPAGDHLAHRGTDRSGAAGHRAVARALLTSIAPEQQRPHRPARPGSLRRAAAGRHRPVGAP
nr:hypothetical protein [Rhodococcus sp. Rp3]